MTLRKGMTFIHSRGDDTIYTITEVNKAENTIRLSWYEGKNKTIWDYNRAVKNLGDGTWILKSSGFPEKWAVERNSQSYQEVNKWLNKNVPGAGYFSDYGWAHYPNHKTGKGFLGGNHINHAYIAKEGWKKITFEEFLEITKQMGEEKMETKQITGYKVVEAFPGQKLGATLTVAEVKALGAENDVKHLEPIYADVFKVGDVVKCIDVKTDFPIIGEVLCNNGNASWRIKASMRVGELLTVENVGSRGVSFKNKLYNHASQAFVLATKEEIDACNNVTFNGYTSEYKKGYVNFGCQTFTKDEVGTLLKVVGSPICGTINIAGVNVTREVLEKILKNI